MSKSKVNVLLVEDSHSDALILEQALAKVSAGNYSFEVVCVETLAECIAKLRGAKSDIVLLDLQLPDSTGITTFLKLQAQAGRLPIIVLTGLDDHAIALQSMKYGDEDYIVKGHIDGDSLARSLLFAIERRRIQAQVNIQLKITRALAESESIAECATTTLASICDWLHWDFGAFWIVNDGTGALQCKSVFTSPSATESGFRDATLANDFQKGQGLPGRVWASNQALFVPDMSNEENLSTIGDHGSGRTGFAFPVKAGEKTLGVIEFISQNIQAPDDGLPALFDGIGSQIGQFLLRKQSEEAQSMLAAIVDSCEDAIIGKTVDGVITSWNGAAERKYGYSANEVIGRSVSVLMCPTDAAMLPDILEKSLHGFQHFEAVRVCKNGDCVDVSVSISPVIGPHGNIIGLSSIARDITQQKLSADNLRQTTERLTRALNASETGLWEWDLKGMLRWEDGMYTLFGVDEGKFIPSYETFMEIVSTGDRERVKHIVDRALLNGGDFDFDFNIVQPNGTKRCVNSKGCVELDGNGVSARMTGVCIDVTERVIMESSLREHDERLNLALNSAKMGVWDVDLLDGAVWRSLKHDQIFGYDEKETEWTFEKFLQHIVPEDLAMVQHAVDAGIADDEFRVEFRIKHAQNGAIHWISAQGKTFKVQDRPVRLVGTVVDISERKRLEQIALQAMKRAEQIADAIVQNAPIGIVILDSEIRVINANAAFGSMIERDMEELLNQHLPAILPAKSVASLTEAITNGSSVQLLRVKILIRPGLEKYWDLSLWPLAIDDNHSGAVLLVVDCTHTILLEEQRDDFVASFVHDIKNPLVGAQRVFDVLCEQSSNSTESQTAMLTTLRDSNQNLLSLLQNLVDFYRYETLSYPCHNEDLNLRPLVASCIKQIANFAESRDVTVVNQVPDEFHIEADAIGIRRVLMNLLHNGVKFSKPGGTVEVTVERLKESILICIIDSGQGISEADQQCLFQRFSQGSAGKRYTGGTGLGLYLSKQIVEAHKGSITCKSKFGTGTTFCISLPVIRPIELEKGAQCPLSL